MKGPPAPDWMGKGFAIPARGTCLSNHGKKCLGWGPGTIPSLDCGPPGFSLPEAASSNTTSFRWIARRPNLIHIKVECIPNDSIG